MKCYSCQRPLELGDKVGFREDCPFCGADLHVCYFCEFYDESAYNDCRESSADRVVEKDKANFCDYFSVAKSGGVIGSQNIEDAKSKLDDLFKK